MDLAKGGLVGMAFEQTEVGRNRQEVRSANSIYVNEIVDVSQWWRKNGVHHRLT